MHESMFHEANAFVTLTYDDKHLPADRSINVKDWQDFAKRLRKNDGPFRFFHCGEYGDTTNRPHYHACVFGLDWLHDRKFYKTTKRGDRLWTSPSLDKRWENGACWIGELTTQSASYVARYLMKKKTGLLAEEHYKNMLDPETGAVYEVRPEYTTMSRRPGIGAQWYDLFGKKTHEDDFVVIDGRKARVPKFYDYLFELAAGDLDSLRESRRQRAALHMEDQTPERLAVRERCLESRIRFLTRDLD